MTTFMEQCADLMPHTVVAQPGYLDVRGKFIASGDSVNVTCRLRASQRLVREDSSGREVVSTTRFTTSTYIGLTTDGYRYTLPTGFTPRTEIRAIMVDKHADETGLIYEVVHLP
jgi:hypothetical protein